VLLDSDNWKTYASLPEEIEEKLQDKKALFSDLLRLTLINNHGGIWVDATCFVTENLWSNALINSDSDFFAFSRPAGKALISNWLLAGKRGNFITGTMLKALIAYWRKFDKPLYYHLFHGIFEVMYFTDPKFAAAWNAVPFGDRDPPHQLARLLERGCRHEDLVKALEGAFVHKLNHRLNLPSESIEFLAAAGTSQLYPPATRSTLLRA
jgi:hypothetical protein